MLVAEIVAERVGKKLDFGDWEGDDAGKPWAREIRQLVAARDLDADDSIDVKTEIGNIEGRGIEETPSPSASKDTEPSRSQPIALGTGYDSDDSLTGYASPSSSRSSSPTPSELDEIAKDPTLGVGVKKIPRPVYLAQLGEMVRSTGGLKADDDNQEADKIEMALNCAEELIRKKRTYGTELGMFLCPVVLFCSEV
jgi:telomere length regulation protein